MWKSLSISMDVFAIGFIISFAIAVMIKALMAGIRYFFNRHSKRASHV